MNPPSLKRLLWKWWTSAGSTHNRQLTKEPILNCIITQFITMSQLKNSSWFFESMKNANYNTCTLAKIWHISAWCLVPQEFDRLSAITNSRHPFFSIFLKMCGKTKIQGNHESAFDYYLWKDDADKVKQSNSHCSWFLKTTKQSKKHRWQHYCIQW